MLTRGILIGKIVDDFANLKYQIESRNRLKQFDLAKFCEDFFKETLNICYDLSLTNLNSLRENNPGLDLGDKKNKIAFQITSQNGSAKINNTLQAIKADQRNDFTTIKVFIVGEKQSSYTGLDKTLCADFSFTESNIEDIDTLLRQIVVLDMEKLDTLYSLFVREFRQVKIELEPIDATGNFESSYYNVLEKAPASPPKNAIKYLGDSSIPGYDREYANILRQYEKLASVPRSTREILSIIVERGSYRRFWGKDKYVILPKKLEKLLRMSENELKAEIDILEEAHLISIEEGEGDRPVYYLVINGQILTYLFQWITKEASLSIRTFLNTMDFTILDS